MLLLYIAQDEFRNGFDFTVHRVRQFKISTSDITRWSRGSGRRSCYFRFSVNFCGGMCCDNSGDFDNAIVASKVRVCLCRIVQLLTHWGRVTHILVSKLTIIGSANGLSPGRRQAIIWTNAEILLIEPLGKNFSETLIEINKFSFRKMHLKMSSGKWRPLYLDLNVLIKVHWKCRAYCSGPIMLKQNDLIGVYEASLFTNVRYLVREKIDYQFQKWSSTYVFITDRKKNTTRCSRQCLCL